MNESGEMQTRTVEKEEQEEWKNEECGREEGRGQVGKDIEERRKGGCQGRQNTEKGRIRKEERKGEKRGTKDSEPKERGAREREGRERMQGEGGDNGRSEEGK